MNRMKISTIALAAAAVVALGCGAGSTGDKKVNSGSGTSTAATDVGTSAAPAASTKPAGGTLTRADIKLTVKILSKHCFGSAGCNLEFRISGVTLPESKLDKDATYEITYTYKGLEDPVEGTFTLQGDGSYETEATEFGSSKSKSSKVTAVVTGVEKM